MKQLRFIAAALLCGWISMDAFAQSPREQLRQMIEQLQQNPNDNALRERIIKLAQDIKPAPAVPDTAIEFEGRAQFAFKNAKSEADYLAAAREYEKAVLAAPWVPGYYSDLCTIYEKANKFEDAKRNCEFYLTGLSDPAQITDVKRRVAGLKYGIELHAAADKEKAAQVPGTVFRDCDGCPEMVVVPSGSYAMGGSRQITLSRPFAVGKTEISFAQWDACVTEGGCTHRPGDNGWGRGNQPVMNVNWDDAKQYVAWLARKTGKGYRLLSEAEWEYAARAGTTTAYYWGDSDSDICRYASVDKGGNGCGTNKTSPVGSRQPNAFGLYDMLGNVWEWVEDCYSASLPSDGNASTTGDCGRRVLRGGSWSLYPVSARSGIRSDGTSTGRYNSDGFRVARTL